MSATRSELQKKAHSAIYQHAFLRWENAIVLGGTFVLSRTRSQIDDLAGRISDLLQERGETIESMLQTLREERDRVFDEQYSET